MLSLRIDYLHRLAAKDEEIVLLRAQLEEYLSTCQCHALTNLARDVFGDDGDDSDSEEESDGGEEAKVPRASVRVGRTNL